MRRSATSGLALPFAVLAGAAGLGGCALTSTYGTGQAPEVALFREMTGGLLATEEKAPIQYQPRAPLVMPPSAEQLPAPVQTAAAATAEWPDDPDQRASGRDYGDDNPRDDINQEEYRRLRPLAGVLPEPARTTDYGDPFQPAYDIVHSKEQRQAFQQALADSKGYGRTERRYLTDPPASYREPAPTAPTEFENIDKKKGFWLTRWLIGG